MFIQFVFRYRVYNADRIVANFHLLPSIVYIESTGVLVV